MLWLFTGKCQWHSQLSRHRSMSHVQRCSQKCDWHLATVYGLDFCKRKNQVVKSIIMPIPIPIAVTGISLCWDSKVSPTHSTTSHHGKTYSILVRTCWVLVRTWLEIAENWYLYIRTRWVMVTDHFPSEWTHLSMSLAVVFDRGHYKLPNSLKSAWK